MRKIFSLCGLQCVKMKMKQGVIVTAKPKMIYQRQRLSRNIEISPAENVINELCPLIN